MKDLIILVLIPTNEVNTLKICVATARNKLTVPNITAQLLEGVEYFINHWKKFIEELREHQ